MEEFAIDLKLYEVSDLMDKYIHFYNHERIRNKTGVTPVQRHSAQNEIFLIQGLFNCLNNLDSSMTEPEACDQIIPIFLNF